jgi:hypothetical protein
VKYRRSKAKNGRKRKEWKAWKYKKTSTDERKKTKETNKACYLSLVLFLSFRKLSLYNICLRLRLKGQWFSESSCPSEGKWLWVLNAQNYNPFVL